MICNILGVNNPTKFNLYIVLLGMTIIITLIFSKILLIIVIAIIQSNIFKKIESYFLNPKKIKK